MRRVSSAVAFCRTESVETCPACGERDRRAAGDGVDRLFGLPGRFPLVRCRTCEAAYLAERPVAADLHRYYPDDYYAYGRPAAYALFSRADPIARAWYAAKRSVLAYGHGYRHLGGNRALALLLATPGLGAARRAATFGLDVLLHPFVEDGALLEVGCGSGMYLGLMQALGWHRVVGVDFDAAAIARARAVFGIEAYAGDLAAAALPDGAFDAVSLSHTLEHVPDPVALLAEIRRVMKPSGQLAIVVPNLASTTARSFGPFWNALDVPRHVVDFTPRGLRTALRRAGFTATEIATTPRAAYQGALVSEGMRAGDPPSTFLDPRYRFPLARRALALLHSARERIECALGAAAGEELTAVARKD